MASNETKTLTAQCHCKAVHFAIDVPITELPLKAHLCHCSICRTMHGTLAVFHATLPAGVTPRWLEPSGPHALTTYQHAPTAKNRHHFCSTCGCQIGDSDPHGEETTSLDSKQLGWTISTSMLDQHGSDTIAWRRHIFTNSAPGGLHTITPTIAGHDLEMWNPPDEAPMPRPQVEKGRDGEERLRAECHCGGVSFTIPRPNDAVRSDDFMRVVVSEKDPSKWKGVMCFCDDCRLTSSVHVTSFTFAPRVQIEPAVGEDLVLGTSKKYESSPGTERTFCGVCGASVFMANAIRKPEDVSKQILNVLVGLLRALEGVLAEDWLTWRWVVWSEDGNRLDPRFTEALREGMKRWSVENQGEGVIGEIH